METKVWSDFGGGWSGTLDLSKVPDNMYDARNMLLYRDGFIGPRPGLKSFNLGRSTSGTVRGILHVANHDDHGLVYIDDLDVYTASDQGGNAHLAGSINAGPTTDTLPVLLWRYSYRQMFISIPKTVGPAMYSLDVGPINPTLVDYPDVLSSFAGLIYGVRYIKGDSINNRILYSAPNDYTDWPANNFIDLQADSSYAVTYLTLFKNNLLIVDESGKFWIISGVPGINDSLRLVNNSAFRPEPIAFKSFIDTSNDDIYFLSPSRNTPASFDGVNVNELSYLSMTPENSNSGYADGTFDDAHSLITGILGMDANSPCFIYANGINRMLLKNLGVWGLHELGFAVTSNWTSDGRGRIWAFGTNGNCYVTDLKINRPAFTTDTYAQPGDNTNTPVDAYIKFAEVWSEDGDTLKPIEIVVDFKKWDTSAGVDNRIQLEVETLALNPTSNLGTRTQSREWTEDPSESPSLDEGMKDRVRFNVGDYDGAGFSVKLSGLRGVAIGQVRVNYEKVKSDGRYW